MSEEELLEKFYKEGDSKWLGIALERYSILLFGVCMKYLKDENLAKDIVQQVFLKAILEIKKYRIINLGGWLYRVAQNYCLTYLREKKTHADESLLLHLQQPEEKSLEDHVATEEYIKLMKQELSTLKEEQRLCITLFYIERKSYRQIAELTNLNIKDVKSHIQNGKRNLKIKLEQQKEIK